MPLEDARAPERRVDEVEVRERPRHLRVVQIRLIEEFPRGPAGRDKQAHANGSIASQLPLEITRALFFEPKPMQLQSACSKDRFRASLAT